MTLVHLSPQHRRGKLELSRIVADSIRFGLITALVTYTIMTLTLSPRRHG